VLNTVGVAQYRLARYQEAVDTLNRSYKLNSDSDPEFPSSDLAFLAMSHYQLGHNQEAQAALEKFRQLMKKPVWARNKEQQGFLREAEALIRDKLPAPRKRLTHRSAKGQEGE
jgi:hypothetical protein